jgi:tetratricopeptide (TPR) repeat protein
VQLGNKQGAIDLARKSLDRMRQLLGDDHPLVANQALFIPRSLEQMGDIAQAQKMYHEAVDQLRSHHEEQSYLYARNIERLGIIAADARRNDEAEQYLREALAIYRRSLRDDSWRVGWTLAQLGIVQRQKGEYMKAIATLSQAVDIFQRVAAGSPLNSAPWGRSQLEDAKRRLAEAKQ